MSEEERLEPYIKVNTPLRPLKNFVSTVSYLRTATEGKQIGPVQKTYATHEFSNKP